MASLTKEIRFRGYNPRRNLPPQVGSRRGESNFLGAFARTFVHGLRTPLVFGRNFPIAGCGIADLLVCVPSIDDHRPSEGEFLLLAFEAKLTDWRRAVQQAYRYRYYADLAAVVLPPESSKRAIANRSLFIDLGLGLWIFDSVAQCIHREVASKPSPSFNPRKRVEALKVVRGHLAKFSELSELA